MRVKLDSVFQKHFFYKLKGTGSWKELASRLNASEGIVRGCALDGNTLPQELYDKLKTSETESYVLGRFDDCWGQAKGGKLSSGSVKSIARPEKSAKLAELVGIMLGDGSIHVNETYGAYQMRIASNAKTEKEYLLGFVKPLFEGLLGIRARVMLKPGMGARYLCIDSREAAFFLRECGVSFGNRKKLRGLPLWIKQRDDFLAACLRGLFDTDGSVFRMAKNRPLTVRIAFKNANLRLLQDVRLALVRLGFNPSKIILRQVFLTSRADTSLFMKKIGFNNYKNQNRYEIFSPVV